jgi:hypothetical protein
VLLGGLLTLFGVAVSAGVLISLHTLPTGLSPVRDAVSHYGITKYAPGYRALTLMLALAGGGAALGLAVGFHGKSLVVVLLLALFTMARAAISWFPMDEPDGQVTPIGARHVLLAATAFLAIFIAAVRFSVVLSRTGAWAGWHVPFLVTDVVLGLGLLGMVLARRVPGMRGYFGAVERLFYVGMYLWFAFVGLALVGH